MSLPRLQPLNRDFQVEPLAIDMIQPLVRQPRSLTSRAASKQISPLIVNGAPRTVTRRWILHIGLTLSKFNETQHRRLRH